MKTAWGLRSKVLFGSLCLIGILMIALGVLLAQERRSRAEVLSISRESQSQLIENVARAHAVAVATQLADALTNDLYYVDLESIGQQLGFARQLPPTTQAVVYDANGQVIHDGSREISTYGTTLEMSLVREALAGDGVQVLAGDGIIEAAKRIRISDQILGGVLIRFDLADLQRAVSEGNLRLADRLDRSTWWRVSSVAIVLGAVAALALLCSWLIQRRIVRPILSMANAARQLEAGNYRSYRLDSGRGDEIGELERSFERMSERVAEAHRDAERRASMDKLTGLPNRRAFDEHIATRIHAAEAAGFALMFIDVDNLKLINDQLGHDAGDAALIDFAQRTRDVLERNSGGSAWLARIGGDEFAVLCTGRPITAAAQSLAESILALFGENPMDPADVPALTVSIGIATYPEHAQTASDLLRCADLAMYQAKMAGKRRIRFYAPLPS